MWWPFKRKVKPKPNKVIHVWENKEVIIKVYLY
jgi:hypothetical protein